MRKPSEYLPAAVKGLRSRLMPDCSMLLCHAGRSAVVTRVGSLSRGEDAMAGADVNEDVRVLALASDFPELEKGRLVSLSGKWRIVTSARTDPAAATLSVGMSAELEKCRASYRRPGTHIAQPVDVLAVEGEVIEPNGEAFAPTPCRQWHVAVPEEGWYEPTEPQVGDRLDLDGANLRVASVAKSDGFWVLEARAGR